MSAAPDILFISRAFPPVIGGIERQNAELYEHCRERTRVRLIANRHGKAFLPIFLPLALLRGLFAAPRADVILLGDAVLAPVGWLLASLYRKPVCCVIHGLDVTYTSAFYQAVWVRFSLPRMTRIFAVGNETIRQAIARGVPEEICLFIPNGVAVPARGHTPHVGANDRVRRSCGVFYLLTLGRLVERKGVAWFIREVLPLLPDNVHYWVAGDGPQRCEIEAAIERLADPARVTLFGTVSSAEKQALFHRADVFVQPNVPVPGDMEGFGLVVLEAAAAGLPVIASRLEGLCDAIQEGENGILVESGNAAVFAATIARLADDSDLTNALGRQAQAYTMSHCNWDLVARRYLEALESACSLPRSG